MNRSGTAQGAKMRLTAPGAVIRHTNGITAWRTTSSMNGNDEDDDRVFARWRGIG